MNFLELTFLKKRKQQPEYMMYVYDEFIKGTIGVNKWEFIMCSRSGSYIKKKAKDLFNSNAYQKIEVQKKIFDERTKEYFISTLCVLEK